MKNKHQVAFKRGDVVSRSKGFAFRHVGIIVGENKIAHCIPIKGAIISTFEEFASSEEITFERSVKNVNLAISNALKLVNEGYKYYLINQNCEHFVTKCESEAEPSSSQLKVVSTMIGILCIALIFSKSK